MKQTSISSTTDQSRG